jgi:hypothetical protein
LDGLVVVLDSTVGVAFSQVGETAAGVSLGVFCIELDCLVVVPGTVVVALVLVSNAAASVREGKPTLSSVNRIDAGTAEIFGATL